MPDVYRSGEVIPEFQGSVKGGLTVLVHELEEVDGLRALCRLAGNPPENPLNAVHRALQAIPLDLQIWQMWQKRRAVVLPQWETEPTPLELIDTTAEIDLALYMARQIWANQAGDAQELSAALSIPDPDTNTEGRLEFEGENPGLVFCKGSITAMLIWGSLEALGFAVTLWSGRGIARSGRAENIVEDMRRKAENIPGIEKLKRIDKMGLGQLHNKHAVILLLHGLLSTDVGVFDSLIRKLNEDEVIRDRFAIVGWPHDTLTGIDNNAVTLQGYINDIVGLGPKVAFVCHSRGGLVARSAAVKLCRGEEWRKRWKENIGGCVTFGTPHEGARLAESPKMFFGLLLAVQAWSQGNGFASLSDALYYAYSYYKEKQAVPGIKNLEPMRAAEETFLKKLLEDEKELAPSGAQRALNILAIGGRREEPNTDNWFRTLLADRAINVRTSLPDGTINVTEHDLIVEMRSSMPASFRNTLKTDCNHFQYFDEKRAPELQKQVIDFLKDALDYKRARLPFVLARLKDDQSADVQWQALEELAIEWKDAPEIWPIVLERAESARDASVKQKALEALARGWKTDPGTFPFLKECVQHNQIPDMRLAAMKELARGWIDETLPFLRQAVTQESCSKVRAGIAPFLGEVRREIRPAIKPRKPLN